MTHDEYVQKLKGLIDNERQADNDPGRIHHLEQTLRFIDRDCTNDDEAMAFFEKETGLVHPYKAIHTNQEVERKAAWQGWEACVKYLGQKA